MVQLFDLIGFDAVFETQFVVLTDEVPVRAIQENQVVDVVRADRLSSILVMIVWL